MDFSASCRCRGTRTDRPPSPHGERPPKRDVRVRPHPWRLGSLAPSHPRSGAGRRRPAVSGGPGRGLDRGFGDTARQGYRRDGAPGQGARAQGDRHTGGRGAYFGRGKFRREISFFRLVPKFFAHQLLRKKSGPFLVPWVPQILVPGVQLREPQSLGYTADTQKKILGYTGYTRKIFGIRTSIKTDADMQYTGTSTSLRRKLSAAGRCQNCPHPKIPPQTQ